MILTYRTALTDFEVIKGDTFTSIIQFTDENTNQPVDLSTYTTAKLQLKETESSEALLTFHSTGATNQIILSGSSLGIITIKTTAGITLTPYSYLYDLQLSNVNTIETIAKGKFKIIQDITT